MNYENISRSSLEFVKKIWDNKTFRIIIKVVTVLVLVKIIYSIICIYSILRIYI